MEAGDTTGTGIEFKISSNTPGTVFLRNRLSGRKINRWPRTCGKTCLMSSGKTKPYP
jgi:hypothetical protein